MTFAALRKYLQVSTHTGSGTRGRSTGPPATSTTTSSITTPQIRASLLVLLQHSIVTVKRQPTNIFLYTYHTQPAIHIHRYAKFVEYTKKAVDATAACCIEELLLAGRLRTVDLTVQAAERAPKSEKYTVRQSVMDAFCKLVNSGFIQRVTPLPDPLQDNDDDDQEEFQFDEPRPRKRVKIEASSLEQDLYRDEDPAVVGLLQAHGNYRETLPIDAVWRVNMDLYHDILRAFHLGRLTAEIHGARVQSAGSLVTAALRYRAQQKHGVSSSSPSSNNNNSNNYESTVFAVQDVVKFLPKPVTQLLEKKPGGLAVNLNKAWRDLSELRFPPVAVRRVADDRYEIAVRSVTRYLQDRIFYQVVHDRHGEVAARVVSILSRKGWLESDPLSEMCMVPSKDTREVLHHLYRSRYVELFQLSSSRQYNPANTIYLWGVDRERLRQKVTENVATALLNIRLRRAHELEVGSGWIERAKQQAGHEINQEDDNEDDIRGFEKFQLGLERLDVAALQLDETLMVLLNF